ncbi:MAG: fumarylacetoacetate hydrolase family protein [bacterium]
MKLVTIRTRDARDAREAAGLLHGGRVVELRSAGERLGVKLPRTMAELLQRFEETLPAARRVHDALASGALEDLARDAAEVTLLAPVPRPTSTRDAYAFRQHVATARRNRGVEMIPEFDQFPVFYFTNHNATIGGGELVVEQDHLLGLDFELECALVVGRGGRNLTAADADQHIAGLTIMNDFSARTLQMEEMRLNLGPAKGKDFATAIGPWLVTLDELEDRRRRSPRGSAWDLGMRAFHNGEQISEGNVRDMTWTFGEILERASYGVDLYPGDVIGSGTVGTGCYLELNGTRRLAAEALGKPYDPVWLEEGDTIALEIDLLGRLEHRVIKAPASRSLLALKKNV